MTEFESAGGPEQQADAYVKSALSKLAKKSSLYAAGDALTRGRQLILLPLYAAHLTPSEYGILALAIVVTQVLQPTLSFGLKAAALKFFFSFETDEDRRRFYGDLWLFYLLGTGTLFLALDLAGERIFGFLLTQVGYSPYLRIAAWTAFLAVAFLDIPRQIFRASGRPLAYGVLNVGTFLLTLGFAIWRVVLQDGGALGAVQAEFFATAVMAFACAVFLLRNTRFSGKFMKVGAAIVFSAPMIPHFMAHWVLSTGDRVILEWFVSLAEIGIYNVGYIAGWSVVLVNAAIMNAMLPLYGNLEVRDQEARAAVARLITYYAGALAFAGMVIILFAPDFLHLVAPIEYAGAAAIIPWATIGGFFLGLYSPSVQILSITVGRTSVIGVSTVLAAVANIVLNILFIPKIGIIGAAVTTAVTYFFLAAGMLLFAQKECHIPYEYRRLLVIVGLMGGSAASGRFFFGDPGLTDAFAKLAIAAVPVVILRASGFVHFEGVGLSNVIKEGVAEDTGP